MKSRNIKSCFNIMNIKSKESKANGSPFFLSKYTYSVIAKLNISNIKFAM